MTHGDDDDGADTRIDGKHIADLPVGGAHLDTHEAKWLFAGLLGGLMASVTGRTELLYAMAAGVVGLRAAPGPLKRLSNEPWWFGGGAFVGLAVGAAVAAVAPALSTVG